MFAIREKKTREKTNASSWGRLCRSLVSVRTNGGSPGRRNRGWRTVPIPIALCDLPRDKRYGRWKNEGRDCAVKPADLTQLAKHNDGQFPFWTVYRVIDGREEVKAHGSRAMPIWGLWFQVTEGSELRATGRIRADPLFEIHSKK